ncbi:MAG: YdcF family protein [Pirellulales bacterium]|nr:YdcF family protein [Pirellulales bacterium]
MIVAAALAYGTREVWLSRLGNYLVETDALAPADVIVVLAGDGSGRRLREALRLKRAGYAPLVVVDGAVAYYGVRECDLALEFARAAGETEAVENLCMKANSTLEESRIVDAELRRRGLNEAIVVTSDYHTRRAKAIFGQLEDSPIEYRFASSATRDFDPDGWWRTRQGRKVTGVEWLKTVHSWLERL